MVGIPDSRRARLFLGTVAVNMVGNLVIAFVHSGKVHVTGAVLAIVGGNAAILAGSNAMGRVATLRWYHTVSKVIAAIGFLSTAMLMVNSATANNNLLPDGAWERGSVYSITSWQLLTAGCLLVIGWRRRTTQREMMQK